MQSIRTYMRGRSKKLIIRAVIIFILAMGIGGALLYAALLQFSPPESYGSAIATFGAYKLQIIKNGFYIYALYVVFVLSGLVVISWLYSHNVAKPFQRIRQYADEMDKGNFEINPYRGENPKPHPLLDAMNDMARNCKSRNEQLRRSVEALSSEVHKLRGALKNRNREDFEKAYRSILSKAEEIEGVFSELKL